MQKRSIRAACTSTRTMCSLFTYVPHFGTRASSYDLQYTYTFDLYTYAPLIMSCLPLHLHA